MEQEVAIPTPLKRASGEDEREIRRKGKLRQGKLQPQLFVKRIKRSLPIKNLAWWGCNSLLIVLFVVPCHY